MNAPSVHNKRKAHYARVRAADYAQAKKHSPEAVAEYERRAANHK